MCEVDCCLQEEADLDRAGGSLLDAEELGFNDSTGLSGDQPEGLPRGAESQEIRGEPDLVAFGSAEEGGLQHVGGAGEKSARGGPIKAHAGGEIGREGAALVCYTHDALHCIAWLQGASFPRRGVCHIVINAFCDACEGTTKGL